MGNDETKRVNIAIDEEDLVWKKYFTAVSGLIMMSGLPVCRGFFHRLSKKALIVSAMGLVGEDDSVSRYCESDEVHLETISQFTGGMDKTGKKIFSGDIIKTYCPGLPVYTHIINFYPEHMAFMARCIETNTVNYLCDIRQSAMLIVGNIYDNPEFFEANK